MKGKVPDLRMESDGIDMFLRLDGQLIAIRGHPGTKHAGQWIPLEPGVVVRDGPNMSYVEVEINGVAVH
jgi:hypothetical protein